MLRRKKGLMGKRKRPTGGINMGRTFGPQM